MIFKLFPNVKYDVIRKELEKIKEQRFNVADIFVDVGNKMLVLHTDNGVINVSFDYYDKLLDAIIRIGKAIFANHMVDALDEAERQLSHPYLYMSENYIGYLKSEIDIEKDRISKGEFKLKIYLGYIRIEDIDSLGDKHPELADAIMDAVERYEGRCDNYDPEYDECDDSVIYANFYAVPEEKRIIINIDLRYANDVGKVVKDYHSSEEFLKALDEYMSVIATGEY